MKLYDIVFEQFFSKSKMFDFLLESRNATIEKLLITDEQKEIFKKITSIEPKMPSKYWLWLAKNLSRNPHTETPEDFHAIIMKFNRLLNINLKLPDKLPSKDINAYSNIFDLKDKIEHISDVSNVQNKRKAKEDIGTIYSDSKYVVVEPKSTQSACYYGKSTKWCISAKEENQFKNYQNDGVRIAIIIDKEEVMENPMAKVAIGIVDSANLNDSNLINKYEIYDSQDNLKTIEDVWAAYPAPVLQAINKYFGNDVIPSTKEQDVGNIQSLTKTEISKAIQSYMESFSYLKKDKTKDNTQGLNYVKYYIAKLINNMSNSQVRLLPNYFDMLKRINPDNIDDEIVLYTADLARKKLRSLVVEMSLEDSIGFLNGLGVALIDIADENIVKIPTDPYEAFKLFTQTKNLMLSRILIYKNNELLGEYLIGKDYVANLQINSFKEIMKFFDDYNMDYYERYEDIDKAITDSFEIMISNRFSIEPYIRDFDDIAPRFYRMLKSKEFTVPENRNIVWFIPRR